MSSYRDFLRDTKGQIDEIDVARARELYDGDAAPLFLDVLETLGGGSSPDKGSTGLPSGSLPGCGRCTRSPAATKRP